MMQIGTVTLDFDMTWEDEFKHVDATGVQDRSIEGGYMTQAYQTYLGRPMTLVTVDNSGWQKRSTVEALKLLAEQPGVRHTVNLNGRVFNEVEFVQGGNPVEFEPVTLNPNPDADFYYEGTIRMVIVG